MRNEFLVSVEFSIAAACCCCTLLLQQLQLQFMFELPPWPGRAQLGPTYSAPLLPNVVCPCKLCLLFGLFVRPYEYPYLTVVFSSQLQMKIKQFAPPTHTGKQTPGRFV